MRALMFAATLLCGVPAWADVISPDEASCRSGKKGSNCEVMGTAGHCAPAHCCRLDYSQGSPPKGSICKECLRCTPGAAPASFAPLPPLPENNSGPRPRRAVPSAAPSEALELPAIPSTAAPVEEAPPEAPPSAPESSGRAAPAAEPTAIKAGCDTSGAPGPLGGLGLLAGLGVAFGLWRSRRR